MSLLEKVRGRRLRVTSPEGTKMMSRELKSCYNQQYS